jgi:hypothetical protein
VSGKQPDTSGSIRELSQNGWLKTAGMAEYQLPLCLPDLILSRKLYLKRLLKLLCSKEKRGKDVLK